MNKASFPNKVPYNYAAGFPGGIASANPFRSVISSAGNAFRAGVNNLTVAAFAWINDDGETLSNSTSTSSAPAGFVYRDQQGLTEAYLDGYTMTIPAGFMSSLAEGGDFFAISSTESKRGHAVYASLTDGSIQTAEEGQSISGFVDTSWTVSRGGAAGGICIITGNNHAGRIKAASSGTAPQTQKTAQEEGKTQ